jgi:DNA-binding NarL/FixJ family response regulator
VSSGYGAVGGGKGDPCRAGRPDSLIAPSVTRRLIEEFVRRPEPAAAPHRLDTITARERDVLTLVGRGMSNAEIAAQLCITMTTVKTYVGRLLSKLNARDRVHLVIIAYQTRLVTPHNDR